ncbi:MAG TPA: CsgG/HfaB family protein [bacterium]|nr:CsgG/HfaB family protein [bacterium]HPN42368.1 CsgG/HfaB family protein [bacterium]
MTGMYKTSLLLLCLIALPVLVRGENVTIAISDFENNTGAFSHAALEKSVPEMLKTELSRFPNITVLERSKIQAVLQEHALAQSGVIETEQAQKVGELVGAQLILTGEISKVGDRYRIDTHIVEVASGKVFGDKVTGPDKNAMDAMVQLLAQNIIVNLTGEGKRQEKVYVNKFYAPWVLAAGAGTGIAAAFTHSSYRSNYDKYNDATRLNEFDGHYDKANRAFKTRNVLIGVSAGILTAGAVMWIKSKSESNQVLAGRTHHDNYQYALLPFYDHQQQAVGIQLTIF